MDLMSIFKIIAGIVILSHMIYKFICDIKSLKEKKKLHEEIKKEIIERWDDFK